MIQFLFLQMLLYPENLRPDDLTGIPLLIKDNYLSLYSDLRKQGARIITQSLKDKQWYEMRINIYDSADHYEEHYERIQTVFSDLDIGMILGETWTRGPCNGFNVGAGLSAAPFFNGAT